MKQATTLNSCRRKDGGQQRRGTAVVMILGLLAITMAMSYAMMRSEVTVSEIQRNSQRAGNARQAALAGLATALRKIHQDDWGGIDSQLSGSLGSRTSYRVTFAAGDSSLTSSDPDYHLLPYRVTVTSIGTVEDTSDEAIRAEHTAKAVLQLVPREVMDEPADWATFQQFTVWQGSDSTFAVELPSRIVGAVRIQGELEIALDTISDDIPRNRYLEDLESIRESGGDDNRPFDGPVHLDYDENEDGKDQLDLMDVKSVDERTAEPFANDWTQPIPFSTYQLYPAGPEYHVETIGPILKNTTLSPDPQTNPLGLYYSPSTLQIKDNVTVEGTMFCEGDVIIDGTNVQIKGFDLLALEGTANPVQLPAVTCDDFKVESGTSGSVAGFVAVFGDFKIESGSEDDNFSITGRLVVSDDFKIEDRVEWSDMNWLVEHTLWLPLKLLYPHFPEYMEARGRDPAPVFTFQPPGSPLNYHWKNPSDTVYASHDDDDGLRWDVIRWDDSP